MSENKKYTFIVIGYNIENFLERCLNSLFSQSYNDYEVVFVNDGSTDNTIGVARKFIGSKIQYNIVDKENGGIISARKAGLKVANGKYIVFVDGDDSIKPDMLSSYDQYIDESNCYDIVISDLFEEKKTDNWVLKSNSLKYGEIDHRTYFVGIMDGSIYHYMCSKIFRKSFLEKTGYYDFPNLTVAEDLYANSILAVNHPRVLYVDYAGYNYHNNSNSVTREGNKSLVDNQLLTLCELNTYFSMHFGEKYKEYISYQWYLFAFGYIQTRYSYDFKRYLVKKCQPYMMGIRKNLLYKNQMKNLSRYYGRFLLFLYTRLPIVARFADPFGKHIIDLLHMNNV